MTRRLPLRLWAALVLMLAIASPAGAATLTITPDRSVYNVGDDIILAIDGDSEGAATCCVFGRLLFDSSLAIAVSATQSPLMSLSFPWFTFPLSSGPGFADGFSQQVGVSPRPVNGPLVASVTLSALTPGTLLVSWDEATSTSLLFFGVSDPQGTIVTIVPEPSTGLLLALGLSLGAASIQLSSRRMRDA